MLFPIRAKSPVRPEGISGIQAPNYLTLPS